MTCGFLCIFYRGGGGGGRRYFSVKMRADRKITKFGNHRFRERKLSPGNLSKRHNFCHDVQISDTT